MDAFAPSRELNDQYDVLGNFYSLGSSRREPCRRVLEIVSKEWNLQVGSPDAIFIMMNPGSSKPRDDGAAENCLVPTKPDTTQYQVMRVMRRFRWSHVRVLNLSDLRTPKSAVFFEKYQDLERGGCAGHSIFSRDREQELLQVLPHGNEIQVPIICAWGVSAELNALIRRCVVRLEKLALSSAIRGVLKNGTTDRFYHPLPQTNAGQRAWLTRSVASIDSATTVSGLD